VFTANIKLHILAYVYVCIAYMHIYTQWAIKNVPLYRNVDRPQKVRWTK